MGLANEFNCRIIWDFNRNRYVNLYKMKNKTNHNEALAEEEQDKPQRKQKIEGESPSGFPVEKTHKVIGIIIISVLLLILFLLMIRFPYADDINNHDFCTINYGESANYEYHRDFGSYCKIPIKEGRTYEYYYHTNKEIKEWLNNNCDDIRFFELNRWKFKECDNVLAEGLDEKKENKSR